MIAKITKAKEIHKGDITQTQGQVITLVSFSPMNRMVRSPGNPIPDGAVGGLSDMFLFVY